MQTLQVPEVMKAANGGGGNTNIVMQCYQQLHSLLGEVDSGTVASAMLTVDQAATTASTLKGLSSGIFCNTVTIVQVDH